MPRQVGRPPESLPTVSALEGPLSSVEPPVAEQVRPLLERLPARAAPVALLPEGRALQAPELVAPGTGFLAALGGLLSTGARRPRARPRVLRGRRLGQAAFRLRPEVLLLVYVQGMSPDEVLPAPLTLKRSLLRVDPLVVNKAVFSIERLPALVTFVALLPAVYPVMIQEGSLAREGLPAFLAPKAFLVGEVLWLWVWGAVALTALVLPLLQRVNPLVSGEVGAPPESLPTLPALVRPLSGVNPLVNQEKRVIAEDFAT